jgi:hypothetical protein
VSNFDQMPKHRFRAPKDFWRMIDRRRAVVSRRDINDYKLGQQIG